MVVLNPPPPPCSCHWFWHTRFLCQHLSRPILLSWIHTRTLAFFYHFAMSCTVFIQTQTPLLAIKRSCRVFSDDRILCHERETLLKLFFFNSWSDIALGVAFWYQSICKTLLTSKNGNVHATKQLKNACVRVWIQLYPFHINCIDFRIYSALYTPLPLARKVCSKSAPN